MPLPQLFAILRTQSRRGPVWQILVGKQEPNWFEVINLYDCPTSLHEIILTQPQRPFSVHSAQFKLEEGRLRNLYFWYLPVSLSWYGHEIPVVDFEYKSWLPRPSTQIPVERRSEILNAYEISLGQFRSVQSRHQEGHNSIVSSFQDLPRRAPTPPRSRTRSESPESVITVSPPTEWNDTPLRESSSSLPKPLRLPDAVGTLLLEQAWRGDDACPITSAPYKELARLSVTSCFHIFDTDAISRWHQEHASCPVCRTPISNLVSQEKKN